jgi:integrase
MGLRYFISYAGEDFRFSDLTLSFCDEYKDYLLSGPGISKRKKPIAINTAVSYYAKFRALLKPAYKAELLTTNLYALTEGIKEKETHREYLSLDEFKKLASIEVDYQILRNAALCSGLTGLRFSDINSLIWDEVRGTPDDYYFQFHQVKTSGAETLPISDEVYNLLGNRGADQDKVFGNLSYSAIRTFLSDWTAKAGIKKHITFHSFRHTYATLQLAAGTDIFTISKLLGHRNVKTTQIYTKIVDEKKREARNRIKLGL